MRHLMVRPAAVLEALLFVVGVVPATAQVDQARAEQYFKEAGRSASATAAVSERVSLCGPMVIADAVTGSIARASRRPAGDRSRELPAPVVVDATTLKGDGWTATVGLGWTVQPGPRPGSFRVVRQ